LGHPDSGRERRVVPTTSIGWPQQRHVVWLAASGRDGDVSSCSGGIWSIVWFANSGRGSLRPHSPTTAVARWKWHNDLRNYWHNMPEMSSTTATELASLVKNAFVLTGSGFSPYFNVDCPAAETPDR